MQENKESSIITFDDDIFYPGDTISQLLKMHRNYPKDIVCMTAQQISDGNTSPSQWIVPDQRGVSYSHRADLQAFTGAGTLFPPHSIPQEAFDVEAIQECAPFADDLWLAAMARRNGIKTSQLKRRRVFPIAISIKDNITLFQKNGTSGENFNDKQWKKIIDRYDVN